MKKRITFRLVLLLFCAQISKAQVNTYSFSQTLATYGPPSSGTLVGSVLQDDDINQVNLPFPFNFNGISYTNVNVCANGYLSFNALGGSIYNPISDISTQNIISAFGQDLLMGTLITGSLTAGSNTITNCSSVSGYSVGDIIFDYNIDFGGVNPTITAISFNNIVVNINSSNTVSNYDVLNTNGYIKQLNSGVSPNQVVEFEFRNFCRMFVYDEIINFKIRLYENSNSIEVQFGDMIAHSYSSGSEVGLKGNTTLDFNSRKVTPQLMWMTSVSSGLVTDNCDFSNQNQPITGLLYKWIPLCSAPSLSVVSSKSVSCSGDSINITVSGANSYSWNTGASSAQVLVIPTITSNYTVIGYNGNCSSSVSITQSVVNKPSIQITPNLTLSCAGQSVSLTASGALTYTWNNGFQGSVQIVSPTVTSNYTVVGSNGVCSTTFSITQIVSNCNGIAQVGRESVGIKIYPNPFSDDLHINNTNNKSIKLNILNAIGELIYSAIINAESKEILSTNSFPPGIYIVMIGNSNYVTRDVFIKK